VYLYDAEASTEPVVCVSCRQDGQASSNNAFLLLQPGKETSTFFPRTLVVRGGQPIVFFKSMDPLTGETSEASQRVYEWVHDQVFLLAGARSTAPQLTGAASADGTDVFFDTSQKLSWEDRDERPSIYDARIGGGFAGPSPPPAPCVATTEGSCQGTASSPQPASSAGTARFSGPGNVQPTKKHHKKKHHKKKHHKKKHRKAEGRAGK
jgi:hypothetical protein